MTTADPPTDMGGPDDRDVLAGELALGVLEGEERAEALRLVLADRRFAAAVAWWRERFDAWFDEWPEVAPDPAVEARITAALGDRGPTAIVPLPGAAVGRWRALAGVSTLAAACLLAALVLRPERAAPPPIVIAAKPAPAPLVAVLSPAETGKPFAALFDRGTGTVTLVARIEVPASRVAELWSIGADGKPRSLGLLPGQGARRVPVAPGRRDDLGQGVVLAVSIEPAGGSTTGTPTGPVIASGPLETI
jgi:anti-sigma-K factor RskA